MSADLIGILAVGAALLGVMVSLFAWMRADNGQLRRDIAALGERMSKLETDMSERMGRLETELIGLKAELGRVKTELTGLKAELGRVEADLGEHVGALGQRMARVEGMIEVLSQAIGIGRPNAAE